MASLEQMLRAGERFEYRTLPGWQPLTWAVDLAAVIIVAVPAAIAGLMMFDGTGLAVLATPAACLALTAPFWARRIPSADVAITNQRILRLDTARDRFDYIAVDLAEVCRVAVRRGVLEITKPSGARIILRHPKRAREIAETLCRAAGLPAPSKLSHDVPAVGGLMLFLGSFGMAAFGSYVLQALKSSPIAANGFLNFAFSVVIAAGACAAWWLLVCLLCLVALRPFLTRQKMRRLVLRNNFIFDVEPQTRKQDKRLRFALYLALRFVDFLYSRPAAVRPEGHGSGG